MTGWAFVVGVIAWVVSGAMYAGASYMSCWAYTDHWPLHAWWFVVLGVICGASHGIKAAKSMAEP